MKVGVPKETAPGETRVGLVPETVGRLVKEGFGVVVESGAGREYDPDSFYEEAGAEVVGSAGEVYASSDLIVKVAKPTAEEVAMMRPGQALVCFLNGPQEPELVRMLAEAGVTVFSNEAIPRTSVAQAMDALSSMGSIAGYKTALVAANTLGRYVPMLSTAAGTTKAANVMVFGVAVAGLQAIAIMNRLGANVFAYDIRPETKEQASSLGATFVDSDDLQGGEKEDDGWQEYRPEGWRALMVSLGFYSFGEPPRDRYVVEGEEEPEEESGPQQWSREKLEADQALIRERITEMDVVITTALVPGRKAPMLVDRAMVESMKPGAVVVDLAAEAGGNCELTRAGETVEHGGVQIVGPVNVPSSMPIHASQLLSRNMHNLIKHVTETGDDGPRLALDFGDEIVSGMCIAHGGEVRHAQTLEALGAVQEGSG